LEVIIALITIIIIIISLTVIWHRLSFDHDPISVQGLSQAKRVILLNPSSGSCCIRVHALRNCCYCSPELTQPNTRPQEKVLKSTSSLIINLRTPRRVRLFDNDASHQPQPPHYCNPSIMLRPSIISSSLFPCHPCACAWTSRYTVALWFLAHRKCCICSLA
jgi:hypothetical protein